MKLKLDIAGDQAVRDRLLRIGSSPRKVLDQTAVDVEDYIRDEAAKHQRTGALVSSVYKRRITDGWELGHDPRRAPHAVFVHWGTRPHKIRPRHKKALRWPSGGAGFVFARGANHPGYRGDPWLTRAAARAPQMFKARLRVQLNKEG